MIRATFGVVVFAGGLLAVFGSRAEAQVVVQVGVTWEWGDDGWRMARPAYEPVREVRYVPPREVVYYASGRPLRVPPGHRPPPGLCRPWFPGVPPGHQPPSGPCDRVFRAYGHSGAVILGAPAPFGHVVYDDDRGHRGKRKKHGRH